ncbi:DUF4124 domain-containing protein [Pseudoxanthomonas sp. SGT-18]|uniref:DUF4124 domain-containing protein n=1 Tax=Pseudoxanthomonas sp. SGT-18 TaxID=2493087 RepID=UPI000F62967F|nr:DUF4124 domain-containing protein [Pseudoxanthomonas sp. SGT-18]
MRPTTRACLLLLVAATFASGTALASTIYKWKDANGVTHSSDQPPPGQRYETRKINGGGYAVETPDAEPAPAASPQCDTARKNLALLERNTRVQVDSDGDGKPDQTLGPEQRQAQKDLAEAAIRAHCPPA